ncbi:ankyrin [Choiromyces venosus 120613-1]|uniref:Ankyrin n=1 Tax=Choiromyces venosus 120613-1 TaxID=1336337 RepID=A0A3N4J8Y2_9PEZI|nr:ankyrin [Choiromyces venosus 120613-1]
MSFLHLPNEIILSITQYQTPPEICALCLTNRHLSSLLPPELLKSACRLYQGKTYAHKALYSAADRGDTPAVRALLKHGVLEILENTPVLHEAARARSELAIKTLIDSGGFDPTSRNAFDETPLFPAVLGSEEGVLRLLLECPGQDVNLRPKGTSWPLLTLAAYLANAKVVALLLAQEQLLVNATDEVYQTALFKAVAKGDKDMVRLFLGDPRTNVNHCDRRGRTAFITACMQGHHGAFELLLDLPRAEVNATDTGGRTGLHWCVERHRPLMVSRMVASSRVEVNRRDLCRRTPFFVAVAEDAEAARILAADPRVNVNVTGGPGGNQHALVVAAEKGLAGIVEMLLQREDVDFSVLKCKATTFGALKKSYGGPTAHVIVDYLVKRVTD